MTREDTTAAPRDYLLEAFGPGGLLAHKVPGYEMRPGQLALARLVELAMREGKHALAEGPCGTGKSLAYGIPAAYHAHHAKKRVVIATANIALQEQLVRKDLPLLRDVLPWPVTFALWKGRGNYLCVDRHTEAHATGELFSPPGEGDATQLSELRRWADTTTTGDISELPFVPAPQVWARFSVTADDCKGRGCKLREACFSERAYEAAAKAGILVTNYHVLFAHLALRRATSRDLVLPKFDLLVLDEAHEAADIARDFFGFSISELTVLRLASQAERFHQRKLAARLREEATRFFAAAATVARSPAYSCRLRAPGFADAGALAGELDELSDACKRRHEDSTRSADERAIAGNVMHQAEHAAQRLRAAVAISDPNTVYWLELDARGHVRLRAQVVDVAPLLGAELFARTPTVLTSATLTASGTFAFLRREVGVPAGALELVAPSPFDFRKQALLVTPGELPEPRTQGFGDAVGATLARVVALCKGRTLGLFTSYRNLHAAFEHVAGCGYRVLRQGDLPRSELTRLFREDVRSVLLGTDSFWTGVDVPGEALTAVVIDKLPFPNPTDPLVDAICARDPDAFNRFLLPVAILKLRQGLGRLIRSRSDFGVIVLLDRRLHERRYGRDVLRSLPAMQTTRDLAAITPFLARHDRSTP